MIKELPESERPREKALKFGIRSLSNRELLAILLRSGYHNKSSLEIADDILSKSFGMKNISKLELHDLIKIKGIKKAKALELLAAFEISRRSSYELIDKMDVISKPDQLISYLNKDIGSLKQEHFLVVYLDVKNRIISIEKLFKGTLNQSLVSPREAFKNALIHSAYSILLVHNHPSGDINPSEQDIILTDKFVEIGRLFNIKVVDHIIVSNSSYFSFAKERLI